MPTAAGRVGRCPARPAQQPAGRSRAVSWAQRGWPYGAWLPACERDTPRTGVAPSAAATHLSLGGTAGLAGQSHCGSDSLHLVPPPLWPAVCLGLHGKAGKFQPRPGSGARQLLQVS